MSSAPTPIVTQDGAPQDWRASLPEDLKGEKSFEKFKGVPDLAKSYVEIQKSMGNALRIPKDDAPQEEVEKFYSRLGRPESPDKYEFKAPEGVTYDETIEKNVRAQAHAMGLNKHQAQKYIDARTEEIVNFNKYVTEGIEAIKSEQGPNFEKYTATAKGVVTEFGNESIKAKLSDPRLSLGNEPDLVRLMASVGGEIAKLRARITELTSEEKIIGGDENTGSKDDVATIKAEINAMYDPKHPYMDARLPQGKRDEEQKKMLKLQERLLMAEGLQ